MDQYKLDYKAWLPANIEGQVYALEVVALMLAREGMFLFASTSFPAWASQLYTHFTTCLHHTLQRTDIKRKLAPLPKLFYYKSLLPSKCYTRICGPPLFMQTSQCNNFSFELVYDSWTVYGLKNIYIFIFFSYTHLSVCFRRLINPYDNSTWITLIMAVCAFWVSTFGRPLHHIWTI